MLGSYKRILKTESFTQSVELSAVIFAHFLADSSPSRRYAYHDECQELIYNLLYGTLGIATPNYKNFLREDLAAGRLSLLGHCISLEGLDKKVSADISEHLITELESMVLNDKIPIKQAEGSLMYFHSFLANANKGLVEEKILPQIEFIQNRSSKFLAVNAKAIGCLRKYQIEDKETLLKWTSGLLSDEVLMSLEQKESVKEFLKNVFKLCSGEKGMKLALVNDLLLQKFKDSKRGNDFSTIQRQGLIHFILDL